MKVSRILYCIEDTDSSSGAVEEARSRNPEIAGSDSTRWHPFNSRAASRNFPNLSELSDISTGNKSENCIGNFRHHRKIDVSKKGEPSEKRRNFPMYRNLSTWRTYFTVIHTGNLFRHIASLVLRHPVWMTGFSVNSSYSVVTQRLGPLFPRKLRVRYNVNDLSIIF